MVAVVNIPACKPDEVKSYREASRRPLTFLPHRLLRYIPRQDTAVDVSVMDADTHRCRQLPECVDISHLIFCWAGFTGGNVDETQGKSKLVSAILGCH